MRHMMIHMLVFIHVFLLSFSNACTIFSGQDSTGNVWAGNNEDYYFTFLPRIHIKPAKKDTLGFIYFDYGEYDTFIQGGVNEAGLFFDGNSVPYSEYKSKHKTKTYSNNPNDLILHILSSSKSVPEVFDLLKKYKPGGIESSQLHFADSLGNLGIVTSDSMWITTNQYQVSTNFKAYKKELQKGCDRFMSANEILKKSEPSFKSFTDVCSQTRQQKSPYTTIYSNIHNLNTGEIMFYYVNNYNTSYKTSINDLLAMGDTCFSIYTLFKDHPLANMYDVYKKKGSRAVLKAMKKYSTLDKIEILDKLSYGLFLVERDFESMPLLEEFGKLKKDLNWYETERYSIALFVTGQKKNALDVITSYLQANKNELELKKLRSYMIGEFPKDANVTIELDRFAKAKYVYLDGLLPFKENFLSHFLIQENGKWIGKFRLPPGEHYYTFFVEGKGTYYSPKIEVVSTYYGSYHKMTVQKEIQNEISLPKSELIPLTGDYQLLPDFILSITEEGGKLYSQATNQERAQIYPSSHNEFFFKEISATISFITNENGEVSHLILHQNGDYVGNKLEK